MPTTQTDAAIRRRWPTPPPLTRTAGEAMPDRAVLEEYPDDTGQALWRALRDVKLWRAARGKRRGPLFPRGSDAMWSEELIAVAPDPELREPLERIAAIRTPRARSRVDEVAEACRAISEWAESQGRYGTALAFMQAAALLEAEDARTAYLTGRLARRRAEYARAESWFFEAISRALQRRDWDTYARTFIGLGNLHVQRGNFPLARRCHERAYRIAGKRDVREVRAMAAHDLFAVAVEVGSARDALHYAGEATQAYGAGHPRLPSLAHDVASYWADNGDFLDALPVFRAMLPHMRTESDRLLTLGAIARASGALDDRAGYLDAAQRIEDMVKRSPVGEGAAAAFLGLAQGALSLRDWDAAEHVAERAYRTGVERREAQVQFQASLVAEAARNHRRAQAYQAVERAPTADIARERRELASELVETLHRSPMAIA